ncbi:Na+/H+ antiporter subunit E [Streptomyces xiaopingdaonensis]|uniref:Na+/H+ antiporter subunit E n=1 Tax=Streptomyces xiaopingdaonensis TaxID=1565415 RepID=UPI0004942DF7|nr:Na+/H+ antiporter subunit E [Streptomyces xiaopingdaonensis]
MTSPQRFKEQAPGRFRATQWPMIVGLMIVWVLLWGELSVANVLTGLLVGVLVCVAFPLPPIETQARLHPLGVTRFLARFVLDMLISSWRLNRFILGQSKPSWAVLRVRMRCPGDLMMTGTAIAVSAVPGSTVLEVHRATGTLYIHVLGADSLAERERAVHEVLRLEARVVRAFGTPDDVAAMEAAETAERVIGPWT